LLALDRFVEKKLLPPACVLLSFFKKKAAVPPAPKSVLVIRLWALGESVLCLPAIKALKEARPDSRISVLCTKANEGVFAGQEFVDERVVVSGASIPGFIVRNFRKYDLAIDTEPHFAISAILSFFAAKRSIGYGHAARSRLYDATVAYNDRQHAVFTICDLLKPLGISARPDRLVPLKYDEAAKNTVHLHFAKNSIRLGEKPMIGMHAFCGPTASWRAWPKERFAALIDRIVDKHDCIVILTGSASEARGNEDITGCSRAGATCSPSPASRPGACSTS
jgi:heptosyltransferase-2